MSFGWWFVSAGDTHFNWAKEPTFECPNADPVTYVPSRFDGQEGTWTLDRPEVAVAAEAMGADPILLGKLLRQRHASMGAGRLRVAARLTDQCSICGTKMIRKGFRAWIDEPREDDHSGQRIAERLGMNAPRRVIRVTYLPTKREAAAWARHECKRAKEGTLTT